MSHAAFDAYARRFRWSLPARMNMGVMTADAWAARDPRRPAIILHRPSGDAAVVDYAALAALTNRLANALTGLGVGVGETVAILLPQGLEAAAAHIAVYKMGAVALPLSVLFGTDALAYRLRRADAVALIATTAGLERVDALRVDLPALRTAISVGGPAPRASRWDDLLAVASDSYEGPATGPSDPALMIFTSGTTGMPKPALHGHSVLEGHRPGIDLAQDGLGRPGDVMWTPADWAWAGGLLNALLPALAAGVPVLAHRFEKFDPELACRLMADHRVTNAFLPPTALKLMRPLGRVKDRFALALRAVGSAGESLGREAYAFGREALGVDINEFYGQTECNAVIGSAHALGIGRAGAIGVPIPGHEVAVIDPKGHPLPAGQPGQIAIRRPDPVMFLGYRGDPEATAAKFVGDWMTTGDSGVADEDGYIAFVGRDDDVITSAGYRIGPGEIEDCLIGHPDVRLAVVVGKPDPVRTEIVKAYVVLRDGAAAGRALEDGIRAHVRARLSAHEYPREIEFVDEIPMTTSGKLIRRHFRDRAREEARPVSP
jgi:acetyl-CoA synthetase